MMNQTELQTIEADLLQGKAPVAYQQADPAEQQAMDSLIQAIDLNDSNSILYFGAAAQRQLASISDDMLEGVRNKDTGPAGEALNRMVFRTPDRQNQTRCEVPAALRGSARPDRYHR